MLNPAQSAGGQIRGGAQPRLLFENFKCPRTDLEGKPGLVFVKAGDDKNLIADLPDMRFAPLDYVCRCRQLAAKVIERFGVQIILAP